MLNKFCCHSLDESIEKKQMIYDPITATVQFYINDVDWSGHDNFCRKVCKFCPYCGARLHKDLINELEKVLENEYGIMLCDVDLNTPETLPKEFQTDEWWIKRKL